jgi:SnoaL-like polyketide cyclase
MNMIAGTDETPHRECGARINGRRTAPTAPQSKNLSMGTEEQITEGNRVASRWVLHGTYHGRSVTLRGITISRFAEDGRILEDRGHSDSISLVRQLGMIRTLILGLEILTRRVKLPKGALSANSAMG